MQQWTPGKLFYSCSWEVVRPERSHTIHNTRRKQRKHRNNCTWKLRNLKPRSLNLYKLYVHWQEIISSCIKMTTSFLFARFMCHDQIVLPMQNKTWIRKWPILKILMKPNFSVQNFWCWTTNKVSSKFGWHPCFSLCGRVPIERLFLRFSFFFSDLNVAISRTEFCFSHVRDILYQGKES